MAPPLLYVDTSRVREGALSELKRSIGKLAEFVDANEPRILAYNVYFNEGGSEMSVVHAHPDSESLEYHMDAAGPAFAPFADLLTLSSIRVYGEPSHRVTQQLEDKARLLGCRDVGVHRPHAGFSRFATS